MTMIELHAAALNSKLASYHEFLSRYSTSAKVVYGFVEGKTDPCFYRGFIENRIPEEWDVELWPAGNKEQVYRIHSYIDWDRIPKARVCFFVDRDLSDLIPESFVADLNIYVTDNYSIENDLVKRGTCRRVLTEVCGLAEVNHNGLDAACDLFEMELEKFAVALIPIMAWILFWRRSGTPANLGDIAMKDLFTITNGILNVNARPKGKANAIIYIHEQCKVAYNASANVADIEAEFRRHNVYRRFTRGKYLFWFLVEFCCSVRGGDRSLFKSSTALPRMNVTFSASNGVTIIGHRSRLPKSLNAFLGETYCAHIQSCTAT